MWGLTRRSRALRIEVLGRDYVYVELGRRRRHELRRDGARVRMTRSSWHLPKSVGGTWHGPVDAVDIGLAILFEAVNTRSLSGWGAVASGPGRLLSRV
ncbi:hypothetical protein ACMA1D_09865 [Streptomyces sp. 796.1]|uniref:hypothetical protein n=1 Tax=Streptomyces sp. 796.1 TaxID=3163029 RepID=UPI0039C9498D